MTSEAEATARVAADALCDAAAKIREAVELAAREDPTPQDVHARLGALHDVAVKLQRLVTSCASVLEAAAREPGLVSSDGSKEPRVLAGHASYRLRGICADRYVSGLVEQLAAARLEVSTLSVDELPVESALRKEHAAFVSDLAAALDVEAGLGAALSKLDRPGEGGEASP